MNIYLDQCSNTTIQKNLVYYTNDKLFWRNTDSPKAGIELANEGIQSYPIGHDRKIFNNILVNNGVNIGFWGGKVSGASLINDLIANNTSINAYSSGIGIDSGNHRNTKIFNNIVYQEKGTGANNPGGNVTFSNNLWYPQNGITGQNDVRSDPRLQNPNAPVSAGNVDPVWYSIKESSSPAINKALVISGMTVDYSGNIRDSQPDIGAYEYSPSGNPTSPPGLPTGALAKAGDANADGKVDGIDYVIWLQNYNKSVSGAGSGDFNVNGFVDGLDYVIWLNNYVTN